MLVNIIKLGRPQFLLLGLAVYGFGAAWAAAFGSQVSWLRLSWGALVVLLAQLSVSYSNDYFDQKIDQPGSVTPLSGGSGVLIQHPELRQPARLIALALITASLLGGAVFFCYFHLPWWLILFVILGNLGGWFYSAPPLRLSERGLGELCLTLILSFLVPGMGYIAAGGQPGSSGELILLPLIFYSLACSLDVELPDLEVDLAGGKKTWVVRWGRQFSLGLIGLLFLCCTIFFFLLAVQDEWTYPVNFYTLGLFSFIPLCTGTVVWLRRPLTRKRVTESAIWILTSLMLFVILVDAYLIWLSTR